MKNGLRYLTQILILVLCSCSENEDAEDWINKQYNKYMPPIKVEPPRINYDSLWLRCDAKNSTSIEYDFGLKYWGPASDDTSSIARGVCWSTKPGPTVADNKTSVRWGNGTHVVDSLITGLEIAHPYYIRAYITTKNGRTSYSKEQLVTTLYVTTIPPYEITVSSALTGGKDSYMGPDVIERGVSFSSHTMCERMVRWGFTKTKDKNDTVAYSCPYTNPNPGACACVTAYVITADDIIHYGDNISFCLKRY